MKFDRVHDLAPCILSLLASAVCLPVINHYDVKGKNPMKLPLCTSADPSVFLNERNSIIRLWLSSLRMAMNLDLQADTLSCVAQCVWKGSVHHLQGSGILLSID